MKGAIEVTSRTMVAVVYEARTGSIRHVHSEETLPGGKRTDLATLRRRAMALARSSTRDRIHAPLALLVVKQRMDPDSAYRVDISSKKLVRVARTDARL